VNDLAQLDPTNLLLADEQAKKLEQEKKSTYLNYIIGKFTTF
jgi:hypothetical protein